MWCLFLLRHLGSAGLSGIRERQRENRELAIYSLDCLIDPCGQTQTPPHQEWGPDTCDSEPGAGPKVERRIIGTQLQTAVVKPAGGLQPEGKS